MSSPLTNVILIGASGRLGSFVLPELQKDPNLNITIVSRQSSKATFGSEMRVIKVADTYPEHELLEAFRSQDAVISITPAHPPETEVAFINAAVKAGVKRFVASEYGSNSRNAKCLDVFPMMKSKVRVTDYLKSKEETGLTWTAIATGTFFDFCVSVGFYGHDVAKRKATIWDSGDKVFSTTTRATIGKAIAAVLVHPAQTANQYLYVSSFQITMNQFVASLKKATGVGEWDIEHVKSEEQIEIGRELMAHGQMWPGLGKLAMAVTVMNGTGNDFATDEKLANKMLGLPKEDLDEVVARVLGERP